ncbi:hypothetical protein FJT64_011907 [Amphibalanus amphitrite]|uniref:F-box domain-containing protein n=1 Tax=Amphibalanus amphitrite TaxID=1232801 RepID=A0A6A4V897_AMPAM|nr:hypothetical protein FJT64_011907 [Amphibalanus amphitrite]
MYRSQIRMVMIRPDKELGTEDQPWPRNDPNTDSRQVVHVISVLVCLSSVLLSRMENLSAMCSRWRAVADSCLALRRDLYLSGKPPPLVTVTDDLLEWLLPRMPRLRCLVIGRAGQQRPLNLDIVSRHCRHLCLAVLAAFHVDEPSLRRLCASCPRLRAVVLPPQCRRRPLLGPLLAELLPQLRYWASQPVCHRHRRRRHRRYRCERPCADN